MSVYVTGLNDAGGRLDMVIPRHVKTIRGSVLEKGAIPESRSLHNGSCN